MIRSFRCTETAKVHRRERSQRFQSIERVAQRKLAMLDAAASLRDLGMVPGNQLETLKKERKGQHAIRINDQWRVCFIWKDDGPHNVEIVDYH